MAQALIPVPDGFRRHLTMQVLPGSRDERQYKWTDREVEASWARLMAGLADAVAGIDQKRYRMGTVHETFSENLHYADLAMFRELVLDTRLWADVQKTMLKPLNDSDGRLRIYRYPIDAIHLRTNNVKWFPKSCPPGRAIRINLDNDDDVSEPINPANLASIVIGDISLPIRVTRRFFIFRPATTIPDAVMSHFQVAYKKAMHDGPADPEQVKYALRTFLRIASTWPDETGMRGPVDLLWHEMILDGIAYAAFCHDETTCSLGQIVNHTPASPQSSYEVSEKYRLTRIRLHAAYTRDSVPFPDSTIWYPIADRASAQSLSGFSRMGTMRRMPFAPIPVRSTSGAYSTSSSRPSASDDGFLVAAAIADTSALSSSYGSDSCGYGGGDSGGDSGGGDCGGDSGGGDCGGGGGCSC